MCVGRYAEKIPFRFAPLHLFCIPAIDMSVLCIPAECDNIKLPIEYEIASRWDAYLLCYIYRHFASAMLHFASLIPHNLRCIPAYAHQIPMGFFQSLLNYHRDNLYVISVFLVNGLWGLCEKNVGRWRKLWGKCLSLCVIKLTAI